MRAAGDEGTPNLQRSVNSRRKCLTPAFWGSVRLSTLPEQRFHRALGIGREAEVGVASGSEWEVDREPLLVEQHRDAADEATVVELAEGGQHVADFGAEGESAAFALEALASTTRAFMDGPRWAGWALWLGGGRRLRCGRRRQDRGGPRSAERGDRRAATAQSLRSCRCPVLSWAPRPGGLAITMLVQTATRRFIAAASAR